MTIKVYEVDRSGFTKRVVRPKTEVTPADTVPVSQAYPPCRCDRCTGTTGWCDWHKGPSGTAVPVDAAGEGPDADAPRYACAPCRQQRGLRPVEER
ncbi:hypothetical protein [Streptomyces sp. NPDC001108]